MNVLKKIVFDLETSGLKIFYDQVISMFGAKEDYTEKDESTYIDVRCSMELSRLPEAEALIVNGVPLPSLVQENSLYNGTHEIMRFIDENTPSIWVAHGAHFDNSILSNTIYQNLASSNLHPLKTNGNILLDSLMVVRAIYAFDRSCGLRVPEDSDGNPIFKLEKLCESNSIEIEAHTAKGDTLALRELLDVMENFSPQVYRYALNCATKKHALQKLKDQPYVFAAIGAGKNFSIRALAPIAINESDAVVVDLKSDVLKAKSLSPLEMSGYLGNRVHKRYPIFRLPLNKGIVLMAADELDFFFKLSNSFDEQDLFKHASELRRDESLSDTAKEALKWRSKSFLEEDPTPEERIYSHFPTSAEKAFINAFNLAEPEDKWSLIESYKDKLNDDRFIRLARRVSLQNWREYCPPELTETYFRWCIERLFSEPTSQEEVPKWTTIYSCLSNLPNLRRKYPDKLDRIDELEDFYETIAANVGIDISNSFDN